MAQEHIAPQWLAISCFCPLQTAPPRTGPGSLQAAVEADCAVPDNLKQTLLIQFVVILIYICASRLEAAAQWGASPGNRVAGGGINQSATGLLTAVAGMAKAGRGPGERVGQRVGLAIGLAIGLAVSDATLARHAMQETWEVKLEAVNAAGAPVQLIRPLHLYPGIQCGHTSWVGAWGTLKNFAVPRSTLEEAKEAKLQGGSEDTFFVVSAAAAPNHTTAVQDHLDQLQATREEGGAADGRGEEAGGGRMEGSLLHGAVRLLRGQAAS